MLNWFILIRAGVYFKLLTAVIPSGWFIVVRFSFVYLRFEAGNYLIFIMADRIELAADYFNCFRDELIRSGLFKTLKGRGSAVTC